MGRKMWIYVCRGDGFSLCVKLGIMSIGRVCSELVNIVGIYDSGGVLLFRGSSYFYVCI